MALPGLELVHNLGLLVQRGHEAFVLPAQLLHRSKTRRSGLLKQLYALFNKKPDNCPD